VILNGIALAMFVVAVWRGSERSDDLNSMIQVAGAWFFVLITWLFRMVAGAPAGTVSARTIRPWAVVPLLFLIAAGLVFTGAARDTRFALSEAALDHAAESAAGGAPLPPGWVGLYPVEGVSVSDSAVRIDVGGQFAFVRDPGILELESSSPVWYEPIRGRWWYEVTTFPSD
jgi:hypothetical protein